MKTDPINEGKKACKLCDDYCTENGKCESPKRERHPDPITGLEPRCIGKARQQRIVKGFFAPIKEGVCGARGRWFKKKSEG